MSNVSQFLEAQRANPAKKPNISRIKGFNEIYTGFNQQDADMVVTAIFEGRKAAESMLGFLEV
jgi:hypothetical protein